MAWYCSGNGSILDSLLGCPDLSQGMNQDEQLAAMRANFGGSMPQGAIDSAVSDYNDWLTSIGYQGLLMS